MYDRRPFTPIVSSILALFLIGCGSVGNRVGDERSAAPGEPPPPDETEGVVQQDGGRMAAELTAAPTEIEPDQPVALRIVNRGEVGLGYGQPITAERWEDSTWVETEESRDAAWTMELLHVAPGGEGVEQEWPFLPGQRPDPGWYRFSKDVQADSANEQPERVVLRSRVKVRE